MSLGHCPLFGVCNFYSLSVHLWTHKGWEYQQLLHFEHQFIQISLMSSRSAVSVVSLHLYSVGQGKKWQNKVTNRNEELGQTNTQKAERRAGTSTEYAIRKSSEAILMLSTNRKAWFRKTEKKITRWLDVSGWNRPRSSTLSDNDDEVSDYFLSLPEW